MTPLQINMLLHYYVSADDYPDLVHDAQQGAITYFLAAGFLTEQKMDNEQPRYKQTYKLKAYCYALCQVPEPVQVWIIPTPQESNSNG